MRPRLTLAITAAYILLMTLPHDLGQQATFRAYDLFTKARVDVFCVGAAIITIIGALFFCINRLMRIPDRVRVILLMLLWVLLALGAYRWLFYTPAEIVHFPQYGILACLLFALTGSHLRTLFCVVVVALLDESYQYWFIYNPRFPSLLDFDDVFFDTLGAAGICLLLHLDGVTARLASRPVCWRRSPMLWGPLAVLVIAGVLYAAGVLGLYPGEDGSERPILISRQPMEPYWRSTPDERFHHVLRPWEAIPLELFVLGVFGSLDRRRRESTI